MLANYMDSLKALKEAARASKGDRLKAKYGKPVMVSEETTVDVVPAPEKDKEDPSKGLETMLEMLGLMPKKKKVAPKYGTPDKGAGVPNLDKAAGLLED